MTYVRIGFWITAVATLFHLGHCQITTIKTFAKQDFVAALVVQLSPNASVTFPNDADWQNVTERWNKYRAPTFRAAVQVATEADIVAVVKYVTSRGLNFFVQSGGHGFAPLDVVQSAIMIQMRNLNHISVNGDGVATVGGGILYAEVINATYAAGREIRSCPCAGLIGAGLGGGIGRLQGLHGLTLDAFRRYRVVLASGEVINVTADEHGDLWWAIRGAGHNFGIVVEADVQTAPQVSGGLFYNVDLTLADDKLEAGLKVMNDQIPTMPPELAIEVVFGIDPATLKKVLAINIVYAGTREAGRKWSDPWKALGPLEFKEIIVNWQELPSKTEGGSKNVDCLDFGFKDIYSLNLKLFHIPTMRSIYDSYGDFVAQNPDANASTIIFEVYSQEGVAAKPARKSAFPNRHRMNILALIFGWWTDPTLTRAVDEWLANAQSQMNRTSGYDKLYLYQNYAKAEPLQSYYGYEPWRLEKLKAVKRKYDPANHFYGYHAIPT